MSNQSPRPIHIRRTRSSGPSPAAARAATSSWSARAASTAYAGPAVPLRQHHGRDRVGDRDGRGRGSRDQVARAQVPLGLLVREPHHLGAGAPRRRGGPVVRSISATMPRSSSTIRSRRSLPITVSQSCWIVSCQLARDVFGDGRGEARRSAAPLSRAQSSKIFRCASSDEVRDEERRSRQPAPRRVVVVRERTTRAPSEPYWSLQSG